MESHKPSVIFFLYKHACDSRGRYFFGELSAVEHADLEAKLEEYTKKVADYTEDITTNQKRLDMFKRVLEGRVDLHGKHLEKK